MIGLLLAFISSFFWATNDYFTKRLINKGYDENLILWIRFPIATLILTPLGIYFWDFNLKLLTYTFLWLPSEVIASVLFVKAIKYAPLSVAMSFYSFMPFFSAFFSFLLLGERISLLGFWGICLLVLGSLLLTNFSPKEFVLNRGILYMLLSTLLFGFNVVIGKLSILETNAYFFSWYYTLLMSAATFLFVPKGSLKNPRIEPSFLPLGVFFALGDILYNYSLELIPTSYVASVERVSLLMVLIYSKFLLKEEAKNMIKGALLMFLGSVLIALDLGF